MSNELVIHYPTGATLYAQLFDATGQIWNGSSFVAPGSAAWTDYDIAMSEVATATGVYRGTMPAAAAGVYGWVVRKQAGGSPAVGDIAVGSGEIRWTGTAEETVPASANVTYLAGVALTSGAIPAAVAGATGGLAIVGSAMTLADDAITAAKIAANAIGSSELAASAASEIAAAVIAGGAGTYSNALTINDGSNPLDGVFIQVSTDSGKTNIVWAGYTNSLGQVTAYSDTAGTHYAWMQLSGYTFTNPTSITMA